MVDAVLDPLRIPSITLSEAEIDEIHELMAAGLLPDDYLERHYAAVRKNVFGVDHKFDAEGNPIEQGFGSAGDQTRNGINAYKKYAKYEADFTKEKYEATLKRMEAELVASDKRRAAERLAAQAEAAKKPRGGLGAPRKDY
jgi:hypothetical protein